MSRIVKAPMLDVLALGSSRTAALAGLVIVGRVHS